MFEVYHFSQCNIFVLGISKTQAKNAAAESAIRHFIKSKKNEIKHDEDGNEKMDVDDESETPLPWQHVASFAIFKLFSSWGEDPNIVKVRQFSCHFLLNYN